MDGGRDDRRARCAAFSLMEVLLALVIVAFGLYAMMDLVASNDRLAWRAERRAAAIELARAKVAELRSAGYDRIAALMAKLSKKASEPACYPPNPDKFEPIYGAEPFLWRARFDRDPTTSGVINLEVRVYWYPKAGQEGGTVEENSVSLGGLIVKEPGG